MGRVALRAAAAEVAGQVVAAGEAAVGRAAFAPGALPTAFRVGRSSLGRFFESSGLRPSRGDGMYPRVKSRYAAAEPVDGESEKSAAPAGAEETGETAAGCTGQRFRRPCRGERRCAPRLSTGCASLHPWLHSATPLGRKNRPICRSSAFLTAAGEVAGRSLPQARPAPSLHDGSLLPAGDFAAASCVNRRRVRAGSASADRLLPPALAGGARATDPLT